ncbi:PrsW family intramembrane metalloprotease [Jatrophihabitans sp. DSM 45814]
MSTMPPAGYSTSPAPGYGPPQGYYQSWLSRQARSTGAPIAVLIILGILAAAFALIAGVDDPAGLLIAVPSSAISMSIVLACYFWLDRWEPEPTRLLLLAFLWGATVAVVVSLVLELATSEVLGKGFVLNFAAPAIEEAAKGAFLLVMLTGARRREFDGVIDGLVYAGFTAVGFAFIEDIGYIAQSFGEGTDTGIVTIILRLVLAPFAHPLFTSMTGIGVGLAVSRPRGTITWAGPLVGYLAAVGLHALWNGSTNFGLAGYLIVYFVVMVPVFVGAVLWARHHRRFERDVIRRQLPAMVYYRWITPMEAGWLANIASRRAWRKAVAARSGRAGAQALTAFQNAATELAFLRDRVERGAGPPDAYYLHAELVQALARNRALAQSPLAQNPSAAPPVMPARPTFQR